MDIKEMIDRYKRQRDWAETEFKANGYRYTPGYLQSQVDTLNGVAADLEWVLKVNEK